MINSQQVEISKSVAYILQPRLLSQVSSRCIPQFFPARKASDSAEVVPNGKTTSTRKHLLVLNEKRPYATSSFLGRLSSSFKPWSSTYQSSFTPVRSVKSSARSGFSPIYMTKNRPTRKSPASSHNEDSILSRGRVPEKKVNMEMRKIAYKLKKDQWVKKLETLKIGEKSTQQKLALSISDNPIAKITRRTKTLNEDLIFESSSLKALKKEIMRKKAEMMNEGPKVDLRMSTQGISQNNTNKSEQNPKTEIIEEEKQSVSPSPFIMVQHSVNQRVSKNSLQHDAKSNINSKRAPKHAYRIKETPKTANEENLSTTPCPKLLGTMSKDDNDYNIDYMRRKLISLQISQTKSNFNPSKQQLSLPKSDKVINPTIVQRHVNPEQEMCLKCPSPNIFKLLTESMVSNKFDYKGFESNLRLPHREIKENATLSHLERAKKLENTAVIREGLNIKHTIKEKNIKSFMEEKLHGGKTSPNNDEALTKTVNFSETLKRDKKISQTVYPSSDLQRLNLSSWCNATAQEMQEQSNIVAGQAPHAEQMHTHSSDSERVIDFMLDHDISKKDSVDQLKKIDGKVSIPAVNLGKSNYQITPDGSMIVPNKSETKNKENNEILEPWNDLNSSFTNVTQDSGKQNNIGMNVIENYLSLSEKNNLPDGSHKQKEISDQILALDSNQANEKLAEAKETSVFTSSKEELDDFLESRCEYLKKSAATEHWAEDKEEIFDINNPSNGQSDMLQKEVLIGFKTKLIENPPTKDAEIVQQEIHYESMTKQVEKSSNLNETNESNILVEIKSVYLDNSPFHDDDDDGTLDRKPFTRNLKNTISREMEKVILGLTESKEPELINFRIPENNQAISAHTESMETNQEILKHIESKETKEATSIRSGVMKTKAPTPIQSANMETKAATPVHPEIIEPRASTPRAKPTGSIKTNGTIPVYSGTKHTNSATPIQSEYITSKAVTPINTGNIGIKGATPVHTGSIQTNTSPTQFGSVENKARTPIHTGIVETVAPTPINSGIIETKADTPIQTTSIESKVPTQRQTGSIETKTIIPMHTGIIETIAATPIQTGITESTAEAPRQTARLESKIFTPIQTGSIETKAETPIHTGIIETKAATQIHTGSIETKTTTLIHAGMIETKATTPLHTVIIETNAQTPIPTGSVETKAATPIHTVIIETNAAPSINTESMETKETDKIMNQEVQSSLKSKMEIKPIGYTNKTLQEEHTLNESSLKDIIIGKKEKAHWGSNRLNIMATKQNRHISKDSNNLSKEFPSQESSDNLKDITVSQKKKVPHYRAPVSSNTSRKPLSNFPHSHSNRKSLKNSYYHLDKATTYLEYVLKGIERVKNTDKDNRNGIDVNTIESSTNSMMNENISTNTDVSTKHSASVEDISTKIKSIYNESKEDGNKLYTFGSKPLFIQTGETSKPDARDEEMSIKSHSIYNDSKEEDNKLYIFGSKSPFIQKETSSTGTRKEEISTKKNFVYKESEEEDNKLHKFGSKPSFIQRETSKPDPREEEISTKSKPIHKESKEEDSKLYTFGSKPPFIQKESSKPGAQKEDISTRSKFIFKESEEEDNRLFTFGSKPSFVQREISKQGAQKEEISTKSKPIYKGEEEMSTKSKSIYKESKEEGNKLYTFGSKPPFIQTGETSKPGAREEEMSTKSKSIYKESKEEGNKLYTFGSKPPFIQRGETGKPSASEEELTTKSKSNYKESKEEGNKSYTFGSQPPFIQRGETTKPGTREEEMSTKSIYEESKEEGNKLYTFGSKPPFIQRGETSKPGASEEDMSTKSKSNYKESKEEGNKSYTFGSQPPFIPRGETSKPGAHEEEVSTKSKSIYRESNEDDNKLYTFGSKSPFVQRETSKGGAPEEEISSKSKSNYKESKDEDNKFYTFGSKPPFIRRETSKPSVSGDELSTKSKSMYRESNEEDNKLYTFGSKPPFIQRDTSKPGAPKEEISTKLKSNYKESKDEDNKLYTYGSKPPFIRRETSKPSVSGEEMSTKSKSIYKDSKEDDNKLHNLDSQPSNTSSEANKSGVNPSEQLLILGRKQLLKKNEQPPKKNPPQTSKEANPKVFKQYNPSLNMTKIIELGADYNPTKSSYSYGKDMTSDNEIKSPPGTKINVVEKEINPSNIANKNTVESSPPANLHNETVRSPVNIETDFEKERKKWFNNIKKSFDTFVSTNNKQAQKDDEKDSITEYYSKSNSAGAIDTVPPNVISDQGFQVKEVVKLSITNNNSENNPLITSNTGNEVQFTLSEIVPEHIINMDVGTQKSEKSGKENDPIWYPSRNNKPVNLSYFWKILPPASQRYYKNSSWRSNAPEAVRQNSTKGNMPSNLLYDQSYGNYYKTNFPVQTVNPIYHHDNSNIAPRRSSNPDSRGKRSNWYPAIPLGLPESERYIRESMPVNISNNINANSHGFPYIQRMSISVPPNIRFPRSTSISQEPFPYQTGTPLSSQEMLTYQAVTPSSTQELLNHQTNAPLSYQGMPTHPTVTPLSSQGMLTNQKNIISSQEMLTYQTVTPLSSQEMLTHQKTAPLSYHEMLTQQTITPLSSQGMFTHQKTTSLSPEEMLTYQSSSPLSSQETSTYQNTRPSSSKVMPVYQQTTPLTSQELLTYQQTTPLSSQEMFTHQKTKPLSSKVIPAHLQTTPLSSQEMVTYQQTTPLSSQEMPTYQQNTSLTSQGIPTYQQNTSLSSQEMLTYQQTTPLSSPEMLTYQQTTPLSSQEMLTYQQAAPLSSQEMLTYQQTTPLSSQEMQTYQQTTPFISQGMPTYQPATSISPEELLTYQQTLPYQEARPDRLTRITQRTQGITAPVMSFETRFGKKKGGLISREIRSSKKTTTVSSKNTRMTKRIPPMITKEMNNMIGPTKYKERDIVDSFTYEDEVGIQRSQRQEPTFSLLNNEPSLGYQFENRFNSEEIPRTLTGETSFANTDTSNQEHKTKLQTFSPATIDTFRKSGIIDPPPVEFLSRDLIEANVKVENVIPNFFELSKNFSDYLQHIIKWKQVKEEKYDNSKNVKKQLIAPQVGQSKMSYSSKENYANELLEPPTISVQLENSLTKILKPFSPIIDKISSNVDKYYDYTMAEYNSRELWARSHIRHSASGSNLTLQNICHGNCRNAKSSKQTSTIKEESYKEDVTDPFKSSENSSDSLKGKDGENNSSTKMRPAFVGSYGRNLNQLANIPTDKVMNVVNTVNQQAYLNPETTSSVVSSDIMPKSTQSTSINNFTRRKSANYLVNGKSENDNDRSKSETNLKVPFAYETTEPSLPPNNYSNDAKRICYYVLKKQSSPNESSYTIKKTKVTLSKHSKLKNSSIFVQNKVLAKKPPGVKNVAKKKTHQTTPIHKQNFTEGLHLLLNNKRNPYKSFSDHYK